MKLLNTLTTNNMKKEKEKKIKLPMLSDAIFLDKTGKKVKVSDIVTTQDCWLIKDDTPKWALTHAAIKKIAGIAGISKNYTVEESPNIVPSIQNDFEHIVRVTIQCNSKLSGKSKTAKGACVHSDKNTLIVTGEANRLNTPNRGKEYLRKMAEKRAYDIAVLEHLDLYTFIFSEEESKDFEQKKSKKDVSIMPGTKEFDAILVEINLLLDTISKVELSKAIVEIKKNIKLKKYSENQLQYLRDLYHKKFAEFNKTF